MFIESPAYGMGNTLSSTLAYYNDTLAAADRYSFGWYTGDYGHMFTSWKYPESDGGSYVGTKWTPYKGWYLNVEMLKLFQKYQ